MKINKPKNPELESPEEVKRKILLGTDYVATFRPEFQEKALEDLSKIWVAIESTQDERIGFSLSFSFVTYNMILEIVGQDFNVEQFISEYIRTLTEFLDSERPAFDLVLLCVRIGVNKPFENFMEGFCCSFVEKYCEDHHSGLLEISIKKSEETHE